MQFLRDKCHDLSTVNQDESTQSLHKVVSRSYLWQTEYHKRSDKHVTADLENLVGLIIKNLQDPTGASGYLTPNPHDKSP